jgi:hypothetical protein
VDAAEFDAWVAASSWQFAKTMPQIPHEYTLRKKAPDELAFERAVAFIRERGWQKRWRRYHHHYWNAGAWKYWSMGAPVEETTLINRCLLDPGDPGFDLAAVTQALSRQRHWPELGRETAAQLAGLD